VTVKVPGLPSSGGVGKWRREFAGYFRGRRVVVLQDHAAADRAHAAKAAASLRRPGEKR
jgi:hypothetical protein